MARSASYTPWRGPNGAALGPDGVYICNNGGFEWHERDGRLYPGDQPANYSGGRIERLDLTTGALTVLYDACDGRPLCGPTISCLIDEGFWFTDHGKNRPQDRDRTGVFYAQADGSQIASPLPRGAERHRPVPGGGCALRSKP